MFSIKLRPGLVFKFEHHSDRKTGIFQIDSISTEGIDIGELMENVKNYKVKSDFQLNLFCKMFSFLLIVYRVFCLVRMCILLAPS